MSTDTLTFSQAFTAGEFVQGVVCQDCLFMLQIGDVENPSDAWNFSEYQQTVANYDVTPGHLHNSEYDQRCWHDGQLCEEDCSCAISEFSSKVCSLCGTATAGYRHDVLLVARDFLSAKMTVAQYRRLKDLCKQYRVNFDPTDYTTQFDLPHNWVAGWVGGNTQSGRTIYVGVSPEGDSHS